jgi:hypothetical protein
LAFLPHHPQDCGESPELILGLNRKAFFFLSLKKIDLLLYVGLRCHLEDREVLLPEDCRRFQCFELVRHCCR